MGYWGYRTPPPFAGRTYAWTFPPPDKEQRLEYWHWDLLGPIPFDYEVFSGTAEDDYPDDIVPFPFMSRLIVVTLRDAPAMIRFSYDGENDQPERRFEIGFARLEGARGFKIRNAEAGRACRYQVIPMR